MPEKGQHTTTEIGQKLVNLLDDLLKTGDWEASLFLRTSAKRLRDLRDEAARIAEKTGTAPIEAAKLISPRSVLPGYIQVYISLYQVEGTNLQIWYRTIKGLLEHSSSRPAYREESHVREFIRSKTDLDRNGYVVVNVKESDIYIVDKPLRDPFNHELINLKEGSIKLANIISFVHGNKKRYEVKDTTLVYVDEVAI